MITAVKMVAYCNVCGGFPVMVRGDVCPPEPDVGFPRHYTEDVEILTRAGKPAPFIEKKMSDADWQIATNALLAEYHCEELGV